MSDSGLSVTLAIGLFLGMEHAPDADHVVAVSTIVSGSRSPLRSSLIGIFWGIGHTLTLLLVGLFVIYILIFGLGSILGMLIISTLIGLPFLSATRWRCHHPRMAAKPPILLTAERFQRLSKGARVLAGLLSIALGCLISLEVGFAKGLFSLPN